MAYELKTKINDASVVDFLNTVEDNQRREDCFKVLDIMERLSWSPAKMWWKAIVWFGTYTYKYASGHTWDWMITWFSPRKTALTLYIMPGYNFDDEIMSKLWKFKTGKSCLYLKKLSDVDMDVLEEIIDRWVKHMRANYETK